MLAIGLGEHAKAVMLRNAHSWATHNITGLVQPKNDPQAVKNLWRTVNFPLPQTGNYDSLTKRRQKTLHMVAQDENLSFERPNAVKGFGACFPVVECAARRLVQVQTSGCIGPQKVGDGAV
jgi:hypothetical protein